MWHVLRVDRKRDKLDRQILDSQERAFWDVHRPAVSSFRVDDLVAPRSHQSRAAPSRVSDAAAWSTGDCTARATLDDGSIVSTRPTSKICPLPRAGPAATAASFVPLRSRRAQLVRRPSIGGCRAQHPSHPPPHQLPAAAKRERASSRPRNAAASCAPLPRHPDAI